MEIVKYNRDIHYATIYSWFSERDWEGPPSNILPVNGYVAMNDNSPIAAAFCYCSKDEALAFMTWVVTDPKEQGHLAGVGLQKLVDAIKTFVTDLGCKVLYTEAPTEEIVKIYKGLGLEVLHSNVVSLGLSLDNRTLNYMKD